MDAAKLSFWVDRSDRYTGDGQGNVDGRSPRRIVATLFG